MNENLSKEFKNLAEKYTLDDKTREEIIAKAREITKLSKQAIYNFHRDDVAKGQDLLQKATSLILETNELVQHSTLKEVGSFRASLEEFAEAKTFQYFLEHKKIPTRKELEFPIPIHYDTYLLGLSDFSGELVRRCVTCATNDKVDHVKEMYATVEELYGLWLQFNFRTSELRKKFDTLRYNLSKIETIVYELHMRRQ